VADDTTTAEFILRLKDEMSGSAASAAEALSDLKSEMEEDQKALAEMEKAMRNLKKAASGNEGAMKTLAEAINTKREAIARAQAAYVSLGGEFGHSKAKGGELVSRLREMEEQLANLPGPLAEVTGSLVKLADMAGGAGWLALSAGLAAVAAGAIVAAKSLFELGLANADAGRNELLHLEALTKMRSWMGAMPGNAKEMVSAIDEVSERVSISREEVVQFNDTLYKSGLRGASLKTALEATAIKASALGSAAGNAFAEMAGAANASGVSVDRLAKDVKNRFGGIVEKQMSSLEVQSKKQKEAFSAMFTELDAEPLLDALRDVRKLLGQNSEAGKALKFIFTTLIQPLFDAATRALPYLELFFDGIVEGSLDVEIAFLRVRNWWIKTFGPAQKATTDDYMNAFDLGKDLVDAFAVAIIGLSALLMGKFLIAVISSGAEFIATLARMSASAVAEIIGVITPAIVASGEAFIEFALSSVASAGTALTETLIPGIVKASEALKTMTVGDLAGAAKGFGSTLADGVGSAAKAMKGLTLTEIPGLVKGLSKSLIASLLEAGGAIVTFGASAWTTFTTVVVPAVGAAIAEFAALAVEVLVALWPFALLAAALYGVYKIFELLYTIWDELDWSEIGSSMWKGIVDGLSAGWNAIKTVMTDLAHGAMDAFKGALNIQSPSKAFADLGIEIPKGVEQGVAQGTPEAQRAVDDMVTVPTIATAPAAARSGAESPLAAAGSASGGGATINIGEIVIKSDSKNPRELANAFRRELESVLEGVALQMGARVAGAP
jgi:hypothetical protein